MTERLSDKLREYLSMAINKKVNLRDVRAYLKIEPGSKDDQNLRVLMAVNLVRDKTVKPSGDGDGTYKVLEPIIPVNFSLDGTDQEGVLDVHFPRSYIDDTTFGLEDLVELSKGDMILITGETNYGKTTIALSILGENLDLFPVSVLMGSEYTSSAGEITPKLKRRLRRMNWVKWIEDGKPRFKLLPVEHDYEDYVERDGLTAIDWISLPGEYYLVDRVMKTIKNSEGQGLTAVVLQKNKAAEFAEGGQRSERYADLVLKIDRFGEHESLLTIGKVKAPKGKRVTGRTWAFGITDYGANLIDIREVIKCPKCWGKGYVKQGNENKRCPSCKGMKYIDKDPEREQRKEENDG